MGERTQCVRIDVAMKAVNEPANPLVVLCGLRILRHLPYSIDASVYIFSISTSPKPEHDTCVAPSISRAKS